MIPSREKSAAREDASKPAKQARASSTKAARQAWPKDLAEQTRAVRGALAAAGEVVTAADQARQFKNAKAPRVEEILDTLVALGHARRTDTGYAPASSVAFELSPARGQTLAPNQLACSVSMLFT